MILDEFCRHGNQEFLKTRVRRLGFSFVDEEFPQNEDDVYRIQARRLFARPEDLVLNCPSKLCPVDGSV
ncbi:hypothetical protein XENORESO_012025 [Xenotaenia resolanae]|uniref:Transposase n=1 Tax=Xenotaenia resolanae TaxID=208358 RepID=A0ABV0X9L3_9TELE